jgi:hypothetical protein
MGLTKLGEQDLEQQNRALAAERDQLRDENQRLTSDLQRASVQQQLAAELRKVVSDQAADDVAITLAMRTKMGPDGEIWDSDYNVGVPTIVASYLDGPGAFLKHTAPRDGSRPTAEPVVVVAAFDPVRAEHDTDYLVESKKKDPEGVKKAWNDHLIEKSRQPITRR